MSCHSQSYRSYVYPKEIWFSISNNSNYITVLYSKPFNRHASPVWLVTKMLRQFIASTATRYGLPADSVFPMITLLLNYVLVLFFNRLSTRKPWQRNIFSILAANICFSILFSYTGTLQLWALTLVSYYLTKYTRGKSWSPIAVFGFTMSVLSANHIYNQMIKGMTTRMDHTAPMVA